MSALERNCREHGIQLFDLSTAAQQGIVHVIGPELGLTQPGMTIACGDTHTSTHGAFGAIAFGIGTSQVRDVLATQCLAMEPLKVRRIDVNGRLGAGVYAKDVILQIIRRLGVNGGVGYAYEYAGDAIERMSMDERMTICNMSIEGGARVGYVNPDETTFEYLRGRPFAPQGDALERADRVVASIASDADAPTTTKSRSTRRRSARRSPGASIPGQSVGVDERLPLPANARSAATRRWRSWGCAGQPMTGTKIDVAFIGSARTRGSPTCARRRGSSAASTSRRTCGRWSCPGSQAVRARPSAKGSTGCSSTPASSGAAPAARCAWR